MAVKETLVSIIPTNNELKSSPGITYAMIGLTFALVAIVAAVIVIGDDSDAQRLTTFVGTIVPIVLGFVFVGSKVESVLSKHQSTQLAVAAIPAELDARLGQLEKRLDQFADRLTSLPCDTGVPGTDCALYTPRHAKGE